MKRQRHDATDHNIEPKKKPKTESVEYPSPPDLEYIGSVYTSDLTEHKDKLRHMFMLPCIKKNETNNTYDRYTYPTLSGHMATHFPVYMTLGTTHLTGLPFFGFANIYRN